MKTKLNNGNFIDWEACFDGKYKSCTIDFAYGESSQSWLLGLNKSGRKAASQLIRNFGINGARLRAKRWVNRGYFSI